MLALAGGVVNGPRTQGDGLGVLTHQLLADLRRGLCSDCDSCRPGVEASEPSLAIILWLLLLPT